METTGRNLAGSNLRIGVTNIPLEFQMPVHAKNTSLARSNIYIHSNTYAVDVTLIVSHQGFLGAKTSTICGRFYVSVRCVIPSNPTPMMSGVYCCSGRGSMKDFFRSTHHLSIMVRCSTSSFKPGEEFDAQVAIVNKTGKTIIKIDVCYGQDVSVRGVAGGEDRGENGGKVNRLTHYVRGRKGVDGNDEPTLRNILDTNSGIKYTLTVPANVLAPDPSNERARVLGRYIRFKPRFFIGSCDETRVQLG